MKNLLLFLLFFCCFFSPKADTVDTTLPATVVVTEPGTLRDKYMRELFFSHINALKVVGPIDKSDLIFLNDISRIYSYGCIAEINLEDAPIEGGIIPDEIFGTYNEGRMYFQDSIESKLEKIILPDNVTEIGEYAFCSLPNLTEIKLPAGLKKIGAYAFSKCTALESITLPDGLTNLPMGCFSECFSLKEVNLPFSLVTLGAYCFVNTALENIILPEKLEKIGRYAFKSTKLKNIKIPVSCTDININAFEGNSQLLDVLLPNTLSRISYGMFNQCTALQKLNIPEGVITTGKNAFYGCSALKEIILPTTLQTVENEAFCGFNAETIVLPENLDYIGVDAFKSISQLKCIYSKNVTAPRFANESFGTSNSNNITGFNVESPQIPIYIPKGATKNYKEAPGWSYFKNFIEVEEFPAF